jgi:hypothetical protein
MAREFEVKTRLTAVDDASATIQKVDKSLAGLVTGIGSITPATLAASAAAAVLVKVLKDSIAAAAQDEEAIAKLANALKNAGPAAVAMTEALQEQRDALQGSSRFSDDAIASAQALLATYGVAAEQLKLATQATVNLAAATGIDLDTAARQVSGTVNGFTRGVDRLVPSLKTMGDAALKSGEGIAAINAATSGAALAQLETYAGKIDKLGNSYDEALESQGKYLTQSKLAAVILDLASGALNVYSDVLDQMRGKAGAAADAQAKLAAETETLTRTVTTLAEITDRNTRVNSIWATSMSDVEKLAAELGVTLARTAEEDAAKLAAKWEELDRLMRITGDTIVQTKDGIDGIGDATDGWTASTQAAISAQAAVVASLREVQQQVVFTAQAFDYLARVQGRGVATDAAVAAGGTLVSRGTRVNLPGGGSRLTSEPGFGRFGG